MKNLLLFVLSTFLISCGGGDSDIPEIIPSAAGLYKGELSTIIYDSQFREVDRDIINVSWNMVSTPDSGGFGDYKMEVWDGSSEPHTLWFGAMGGNSSGSHGNKPETDEADQVVYEYDYELAYSKKDKKWNLKIEEEHWFFEYTESGSPSKRTVAKLNTTGILTK